MRPSVVDEENQVLGCVKPFLCRHTDETLSTRQGASVMSKYIIDGVQDRFTKAVQLIDENIHYMFST